MRRGEKNLVDHGTNNFAAEALAVFAMLRDHGSVRHFTTVMRGDFGSVEEVEIAAVEIVADTVLRLRLDAVPTGALEVHYATKTAAGADPAIDGFGCLRDSDPTLAPLNYVYASGTGQYAAADIASLKDKPYPLHNWGVSFIKPVEEL